METEDGAVAAARKRERDHVLDRKWPPYCPSCTRKLHTGGGTVHAFLFNDSTNNLFEEQLQINATADISRYFKLVV